MIKYLFLPPLPSTVTLELLYKLDKEARIWQEYDVLLAVIIVKFEYQAAS